MTWALVMTLDLDRLRSFVAFANRLNFTHAARDLNLSQPALHTKVNALASDIGKPLYERRGRTLVLTPTGERTATFGRDIDAQVDGFLADIRGIAEPAPLVLAAGEGAFLHLLGPGLRCFHEMAVNQVSLITCRGKGAVQQLESGRAHLAVVRGPFDQKRLRGQPLADVGQHLVVRSDHRLANLDRVEAGDLRRVPLVVPPADRPHRQALETWLETNGVALHVAVEATGWALMLQFVSLGLGAAVVNDYCPPPEGCISVPIDRLPAASYTLVRRRGAPHPKGLDTLVEALRLGCQTSAG